MQKRNILVQSRTEYLLTGNDSGFGTVRGKKEGVVRLDVCPVKLARDHYPETRSDSSVNPVKTAVPFWGQNT